MRKIGLTTADDRYDRGIKTGETTWPKMVKRLAKFTVTEETFEEYLKAGNDQLSIKDVGWYIGGVMEPAVRRKANLVSRSILTLDLDHLASWDLDPVLQIYRDLGIEFAWHSSHKHSPEEPRVRLVFPFTRDATVEEYEPLARKVASWAGMDYFDDTTYQVSRVMFWPSRSVDGEEVSGHWAGQALDPTLVLNEYDEWQDWGSWPVSSREEEVSRDPGQKAEDPYTKPGAIGAFNRVYSVPHAIVEFELPYVPSGMGEDRYSYGGGTSVDGAVYYEDDGHLYSWHESDPARGNRNAFDLVRIHRFGHLDDGAAVGSSTPIGSRPSQKAMVAWAASLDPVQAELAAGEFSDLGPADDSDEPVKARASALTYDSIREKIQARGHPLTNDERRKLVTEIAAAKLTPAETGILAAHIKSAHADPTPSKQNIMDEIKLTSKQLTSQLASDGHISDIEEELVREVMREHFHGGEYIRRFGRQYWFFDRGVWRQVEDDWVYGCMQRTFLRIRKERPDDAMELAAAVGESKTSALTGALRGMLDRHLTVGEVDPLNMLGDKPAIINCTNGEIHFDRKGHGEFTDHHPDLFLTSQIPVDWDPKAKSPEWDRFCSLIFSDSLEPDEMQRHLEEIGGYLIQPTRWLKAWILFHGPTNAGKTTIGKVFESLMGNAAANRSMGAYEGQNNHAEAGLVGKLMLMDEDFAKGLMLPDGFIKKISEAKRMTANPKNKDEFDFICRALPVVISNHWPPTRDVSDAFRERALVFDFLHGIPAAERSDERAERMMSGEELSGILVRFVRGFKRLRARGDWDVPAECVEARGTWEGWADPVRQWVRECIVPAPGGKVNRADCHGWFTHWYKANNPRGYGFGRNEFLDRLGGVLGKPTKSKSFRGWRDVRYQADESEI